MLRKLQSVYEQKLNLIDRNNAEKKNVVMKASSKIIGTKIFEIYFVSQMKMAALAAGELETQPKTNHSPLVERVAK